jgi:hypothetical protein
MGSTMSSPCELSCVSNPIKNKFYHPHKKYTQHNEIYNRTNLNKHKPYFKPDNNIIIEQSQERDNK